MAKIKLGKGQQVQCSECGQVITADTEGDSAHTHPGHKTVYKDGKVDADKSVFLCECCLEEWHERNDQEED